MIQIARGLSCRSLPRQLGTCLLRQHSHHVSALGRSRELACRAEERRPPSQETRVEAMPASDPDSRVPQLTQLAARLGSAAAWLSLPACLLAWLGQPGAAMVAPVHSAESVHSMWLISGGVGAACTVLTVLAFTRFFMSFFPDMESKACEQQLQPWAAFTLFDPMLRPLQLGIFKMESGDPSYASFALLAFTCAVLESLVGDGGLMVETVPDLDLLQYMQFLVECQHGLLLPSWALVVGRFFAFL